MKFTLGEILTVTTGVLLCPIDRCYAILNYMLADNLMTHQLPRASRQATPDILRQHPQLADIDASIVTRDNWAAFLANQEHRFGHELDLTPLDSTHHLDPLVEIEAMLGGDTAAMKVVAS